MPSNPKSLNDLLCIPDMYQKTLLGEQFLLYDSRTDGSDRSSSEEEDEDVPEGQGQPQARRVIVFATRKNIEFLCESPIWFVDGTFKTSPSIFAQIFTVMGLRRRVGSEEAVAIPLVYCLLSGKQKALYIEALEAVDRAVQQYRIDPCTPTKIMSDFEIAITNACKRVFPGTAVSGCFFHLGQSIYRKVQEVGLQVQYNDRNDRSIKEYTHRLLSLAFVPVADVTRAFNALHNACPRALHGVYDYFKKNYVTGTPGRGNRRAVPPRYPPQLWNQYDTALAKSHRTNNVSEGWHNRFRQVVGKHHPDLYSALSEFQKEQGYTEICVQELALGKKIKYAPSKKWRDLQTRLENIAAEYNNLPILEYLSNLQQNVNIA